MEALAKLALEHGLAAIYTYRGFSQAGGTLSYGPRETDPNFAFRHAADFVDKILRGAKPGDLPVEQPMRYFLPSTSRPPRRSASQSPQRCSTAPMRSLNKARHFRC
jgi:putative ABC transport system substrate-binding protein